MSTSASTLNFHIRMGRADELKALLELECAAGERFRDIPMLAEISGDITPIEELRKAHRDGRVWVAVASSDQPIGFAYATIVDGYCHLEELDVLPAFGQNGIGTALVQTVCAYAVAEGWAGVTLTTFREVPWNAPFYERLGFEVLDPLSLSPGLAHAFANEGRRGLPLHLRCAMRWQPSDGQL